MTPFLSRFKIFNEKVAKIEKGESPKEGAVREVEEECGISDIVLGDHLTDTYHTYQLKGEWVLKKTHWYRMQSEATELIPQTEEGISSV